MQARFYAPQYGRFTAPDPARDQHFEDTQSWNIYSYGRNSPIMSTDPTGMVDEDKKNATETKGPQGGMSGTDDYSRLWQNDWNKWAQTGQETTKPIPNEAGKPKTPKGDPGIYEKNSYDGFVGSLEGTGRAFLGAFNPSNWNSEAMVRLGDLGPLGQAEKQGDMAYKATAGSLAFAGAAALAAGGLIAGEAAVGLRTTNVMVHPAHHPFGSLGKLPHIQVNWWVQGAKGSGGALPRIPLTSRMANTAKKVLGWLDKKPW